MVCVNSPNNGAARRRFQRVVDSKPGARTLGWCLEGLAGGIATVVLFLFTFPMLIDLTRPFGLLSTTALVFVFLFVWISLWAVIEASRERVTSSPS